MHNYKKLKQEQYNNKLVKQTQINKYFLIYTYTDLTSNDFIKIKHFLKNILLNMNVMKKNILIKQIPGSKLIIYCNNLNQMFIINNFFKNYEKIIFIGCFFKNYFYSNITFTKLIKHNPSILISNITFLSLKLKMLLEKI